MVYRIYDYRPAQQHIGKVFKPAVAAYKIARVSDNALGIKHNLFLGRSYRRERQERSPAESASFKIFDKIFGGRFVIRYDILQASAKRRFYRRLVFLFSGYYLCDDSEHSGIRVFLLHYLFNASAVALVSFSKIRQRFQQRLLPVILRKAFIERRVRLGKLSLYV